MASNQLSRTQRKLESLELEHLRQLASDLHDQLESANDSLDFWRNYAMQLQDMQMDESFATHRAIGINKAGEMMVVALS